MIQRDINVLSTLTWEYTYAHTSLENAVLINVSQQNIHGAAHYFHGLPLSLRFNTHLQSVTIV